MNIIEATKSCLSKYATFTGRARRSELWLFSLAVSVIIPFAFLILLGIIAGIADAIDKSGEASMGAAMLILPVFGVYFIATILPNIAVTCRRLHDVGKSGAYILFYFIPIVGSIMLLIWMIQDGDPNENQYGPNPKSSSGPTYTKVCATCGCTISRSATVCPNCGNDPDTFTPPPRPDRTKVCATCGCTIDAGAKVCPNCGHDPDVYKPPTKPVFTKTYAADTSVGASPACVKKPDTGDSSDKLFFPPSL